MKTIKLVSLSLLLMLAESTFAQIATDRPGASDAPTTVMQNSFQLEQGFDLSFAGEDTNSTRSFGLPTGVRVGVLKWLELRLQNNVLSVYNKHSKESVFGISDVLIGFKTQLFRKEGNATNIAFVSMWGMPIGTPGLTTKKFSTMNKFLFSHQLSKKVSMVYNLGYGYYGSGKGLFAYTMAFWFALTPKVSVFVENFGDLDNFKDFSTSADLGVAYLITDWLQVDLAYGTGLNWKYNYAQIGIGWNIHKKKE